MPQPWSHLTVICQDVCWTKLTWTTQSGAQEYCNQFFRPPPCHRRREKSSRTWCWHDVSSVELTKQIKSTPTVFKGAWLIQLPRRRSDCRVPFWFVCKKNFKKKRRHLMNSQMKQWKHQEQDTAWICPQEEDEPQKLHNFLISSLPDTWLNSVVQWATLTSTFCMICKTDFL